MKLGHLPGPSGEPSWPVQAQVRTSSFYMLFLLLLPTRPPLHTLQSPATAHSSPHAAGAWQPRAAPPPKQLQKFLLTGSKSSIHTQVPFWLQPRSLPAVRHRCRTHREPSSASRAASRACALPLPPSQERRERASCGSQQRRAMGSLGLTPGGLRKKGRGQERGWETRGVARRGGKGRVELPPMCARPLSWMESS